MFFLLHYAYLNYNSSTGVEILKTVGVLSSSTLLVQDISLVGREETGRRKKGLIQRHEGGHEMKKGIKLEA